MKVQLKSKCLKCNSDSIHEYEYFDYDEKFRYGGYRNLKVKCGCGNEKEN
jgi:hypothetical protein